MKSVLLVFGGKSYEHDISIVTACQIYNKTRLKDYKLIPLYISKDEKYFIYSTDEFNLSDFAKNDFYNNKKKFKEVVFISNEKSVLFTKSKFGLKEQLKVELAIFACHGGAGENGKLVSLLESHGIYSNVGEFDSLAVCMNKFLFKQIAKSLNIPVVEGVKFTKNEFIKEKEKIISYVNKINFPVIIKPNNGGSSIGLFIANSVQELEQYMEDAFEFDNEVLIEKYVSKSREFNVSIMGDQNKFEISEIDEPIKEHEVLTFSDKYLSSENAKPTKLFDGSKMSMASSFRNFPAKIDKKLSAKIKKYACDIFKNLNLRGVVRIDFLYSEEGELFVCEVNTIPGSLAYYFFNQGEYLISDFVLKLIKIAEKYKEDIFSLNQEYITNILN